jgi:MOSC domain-containing protein YiiM
LRWVNWRHWRERRLRGVNTRVVQGGRVRMGDAVERLAADDVASPAEETRIA